MTGPAGPTNPFVVPGYERHPGRALQPWQPPFGAGGTVHDRYYCRVGGLPEAYDLLTGDGRTAHDLCADTGGMIVVNGPARSGRTSLVHRCAQWAHGQLRTSDHEVHIVDLTRVASPGQSVPERTAQVAGRLHMKLRFMTLPPAVRDYLDDKENFDQVLPTLGEIHLSEKKKWFILLLPPLDPDSVVALNELRCYGRVLTAGVICIAESTLETRPALAGQPEVAFLALRHLAAGEARALVAGWPGGSTAQPGIPEAELDQVEATVKSDGYLLTTGGLLSGLRGAYDKRMTGKTPYDPLDYIRSSEIIDAMLGPLGDLGGQGVPHS